MSTPPRDTEIPFEFSEEEKKEVAKLITQYPEGRKQSALLPTLWMAQRHNKGWLSSSALREVSSLLSLPFLRVYEVATFYTMFRLKPVGKHFIQICRTTSCWLRGSEKLKDTCSSFLKIEPGQITKDELFSFEEVECLGACANAPAVQINDEYFEDLTPQLLQDLLKKLSQGHDIKKGSQTGRLASKAVLIFDNEEGN